MTSARLDLPPPTNRTVLLMAWPMTMMAIMLHGIVVIDAYVVAGLGEASLAAMGLAGSLAGLLLGMLSAFAMATQIRQAQAFGSGKAVGMKTGVCCGLVINLAVALVGAVLALVFGGTILSVLAHSPLIAADAKSYLDMFLLVVLMEAVALVLSSHFNACGATRLPFYSYLISLPVNVGTSIALIHGLGGLPEMGVSGAAAGSALGSALRTAFLARMFHRMFRSYLDVAGWLGGAFWPAFRGHLLFALPIAATFISATLSTSVCTMIFAGLNVNQFAAMVLIMPWVMIAGTIGMSWAQATGIIVAQLIGQGQRGAALDRFLSGAWRAAFVTAGLVALIYFLVWLVSPVLYPRLHPETRATLAQFLPILLLLPFPKESNAICGNTLRAAGETVYVMHVFVWSQWLFRVPATAIMILWLDLSAVWVFSLLLLEELVKLPAFHIRLFRGTWKQAES
ncbi:MATE family efflux transporter [Frigidibacter mobilis]|uniref:Multi antimicrobial extrusion protein MatE n=1 Tax=Frigidibacter mobilis TaxID=1335048 RepID=A0A165STV2_9RHOB|nr:MATE family efflux transporter [Frigidibacter mobilis]AMY71019.1 multi antimicrobial extrusion protein MatE [Frigidibacter mobilis]